MASGIVIAVDTMGGDHAPEMVVRGAHLALKRFPELSFLLVGHETKIKPLLARFRRLSERATILHAEDAISGETKPSVALRTGRRSSMRLAIDAVAEGKAHCVVSAGNTGALMAMAKMVLKTLPGIDRPAIASVFPTRRGETVMLDLGANVECDADNLVQFALMGDVFARTVLGLMQPVVGLLNVGSEDLKGNDAVREAAARLRDAVAPISFYGFIEGDDITAGTVDVVVTDGFTGNVALKTAEGTVKLCFDYFRSAFRYSMLGRIGYLFARGSLERMRERLDPRRHNGAVFLGLDGIAVKSHGGADALGFANAIAVAADMKMNGFLDRIREELQRLQGALAPGIKTQSAPV